MAFEIFVKPIAWIDLEEAIDWYEKAKPGLGGKFFKHFEDAMYKILKAPNTYRTIIPGVKRIIIKKFPYKIFYVVSENNIFIIGVAHEKRSNAYIRKKLKSWQ